MFWCYKIGQCTANLYAQNFTKSQITSTLESVPQDIPINGKDITTG
jgi:hypothetical protein